MRAKLAATQGSGRSAAFALGTFCPNKVRLDRVQPCASAERRVPWTLLSFAAPESPDLYDARSRTQILPAVYGVTFSSMSYFM